VTNGRRAVVVRRCCRERRWAWRLPDLRNLSHEVRMRQRAYAEERAQAAPVEDVVSADLLILPAMCVLLAPAMS